MVLWFWRSMEKCLKTNRSQRRITVQIIVDIIIWFTVAVPLLYLFLAGVPYDRGFFCDDVSIQYPYKSDTISTPLLLVYGFGISLAAVVSVEVLNNLDRKCGTRFTPSKDLMYILRCYGVFLLGFIIDQMFVEVVKNETGSLRPNFMDVCRPDYNRTLCPGYITEYRCTGAKGADEVRDSRQSFPSGHAAFSMYIAVYFCFYIQNRLQITFSRTLKVVMEMALLFMATICGFSRITDHKHHMIDVISGFILGAMVALILYRTLGRSVMRSRVRSVVQFKTSDEQDPCFSCETNLTDPTTPTPLLAAEYTNGNVNGYQNEHPLKDIKYNARRHRSMPNTSITSSTAIV